jgi:Sulfatase
MRVGSARYSLVALSLALCCAVLSSPSAAAEPTSARPSILFIIMDDVGIDQLSTLGYGGATPPATPNINQIANAGVRFRNTWAMPACSTSRAVLFEGRYPMRTNVFNALGPNDLANSMVGPFEMTTPKLLKDRSYQSGLFGKFHLGLQGNSPFGYGMPHSLGWDHFFGWLDETGDPSSIDTTAGGVAPKGTYSCGFVPGAAVAGGADRGACYLPDNTCRVMEGATPIPPGRACLESGGILDPDQPCKTPRPSSIDFSVLSAHYVSPLVINREDGAVEQVPPTDIRARAYRGAIQVDAAIDWIKRRPAGIPWMATVSFSTVHTPIMQPPVSLLPPGSVDTSSFDCANQNQQRVLSNQMIEALDTELARLFVETGLASRGPDGSLVYDPKKTDTMIILVGDNGSLGYTVKAPFDPQRAKGTAYQTGVWVPLVVAGPLVTQPGRDVGHMTNIADVFELFGEIAGIDVRAHVRRPLDSVAMLPYLVNPEQPSLRSTNFTQIGLNLQLNGGINGPCQIDVTCTQIPVTKSVCEDNEGIWWGAGATDPATAGIPPQGLTYCCNVNTWLADHGQPTLTISPQAADAIRNVHYKLVRNYTKDYDPTTNGCVDTQTDELYEIDERVPLPKLDLEADNLLDGRALTGTQQRMYVALLTQLDAINASASQCTGDGNLDRVVDTEDVLGWARFSELNGGKSSWFDFNLDGVTDGADLAVISDNYGAQCPIGRWAR